MNGNDAVQGSAVQSAEAERGVMALARLAALLLDEVADGSSIDSFDIQDFAEEHGLLEPYTVTEPCDAPEFCDCEAGDTCFRKAPHYRAALGALARTPDKP